MNRETVIHACTIVFGKKVKPGVLLNEAYVESAEVRKHSVSLNKEFSRIYITNSVYLKLNNLLKYLRVTSLQFIVKH